MIRVKHANRHSRGTELRLQSRKYVSASGSVDDESLVGGASAGQLVDVQTLAG